MVYQAPLSMEFFRQEYWRGISRGFFNPGIEPGFPALQADSLLSERPGKWSSINVNMNIDRLHEESHIVILIDSGKIFDKIQYLFITRKKYC